MTRKIRHADNPRNSVRSLCVLTCVELWRAGGKGDDRDPRVCTPWPTVVPRYEAKVGFSPWIRAGVSAPLAFSCSAVVSRDSTAFDESAPHVVRTFAGCLQSLLMWPLWPHRKQAPALALGQSREMCPCLPQWKQPPAFGALGQALQVCPSPPHRKHLTAFRSSGHSRDM